MSEANVKRVPDAELSADDDSNDGVYYYDDEPFMGVSFSEYPNGGLCLEMEWRHGVLWGTYRRYAPNGQITEEGEYRAGFREGMWREWHPNGTLASETECEFSAVLTRRRWDASGELVEDYQLHEGDPAYASLQMYRQAYGRSGYIEPRAQGDGL
jgi:antitoxin component YwqK of YwqJK toxin-antitoxin module